MYRSCLAIGVVFALALTFGCTPPPKGLAPAANVKGTVTLDGKALPTGELHFGMPGVPPRVVDVKDGVFAGEAPIGKNQVEVYIYVEGPKSEKYGGAATKKNVAPEKYSGPNSPLEAKVEANGENKFKFDLFSQ